MARVGRRWLVFVICVLGCAVALRALWPFPPVTLQVARETTYVMGPKSERGGIDYDALLKPQQSQDALDVLESAKLDLRSIPSPGDCATQVGAEWLSRQPTLVPTVEQMIAAGRLGRSNGVLPVVVPSPAGLVRALECKCVHAATQASLPELQALTERMVDLAAVMSNTDDPTIYSVHPILLGKARDCASRLDGLHVNVGLAMRSPGELMERQRLRALGGTRQT